MFNTKRIWLIAMFVIIILIVFCVVILLNKDSGISSYGNYFLDNTSAFNNTAQYMIRTEGKINIDKIRENVYGYSEHTKGDEYKPSEQESEAIDFVLYELEFRNIYRKIDGSIMIAKSSEKGIEKGIMKLGGKDFPSGIIAKEHIQDDWYSYVLINN